MYSPGHTDAHNILHCRCYPQRTSIERIPGEKWILCCCFWSMCHERCTKPRNKREEKTNGALEGDKEQSVWINCKKSYKQKSGVRLKEFAVLYFLDNGGVFPSTWAYVAAAVFFYHTYLIVFYSFFYLFIYFVIFLRTYEHDVEFMYRSNRTSPYIFLLLFIFQVMWIDFYQFTIHFVRV